MQFRNVRSVNYLRTSATQMAKRQLKNSRIQSSLLCICAYLYVLCKSEVFLLIGLTLHEDNGFH